MKTLQRRCDVFTQLYFVYNYLQQYEKHNDEIQEN